MSIETTRLGRCPEWCQPVLVALALFALYAWSAPRTVALEDDGLFIMAAYFNGIAHPPGYPLYTLLAHLAAQIPVGTVAWRLHVFSGVIAAIACGVLWRVARQLGMGSVAALAAALAYGVSDVFWSQAIIAEVYTLNALIVFALLSLALSWRAQALSGRLPAAAALIYGLGLTNHWPLLVLTTPALLLVLWPIRAAVVRRLPSMLPWLLVGLLPYAWMVWRSQQDVAVSFYGPISSWHDFWFYVSRQGFAGADHSPTAGWFDRLQFFGFLLRQLTGQFGPFGAALLALGLVTRIRRFGKGANSLDPAILLGYLGSSMLLVLLLGFDYDPIHQSILRVYPAAAYGFAALWLGFGIQVVWEHGRDHLNGRLLAAALLIAAVLVPLLLDISQNARGDYRWAERYATALLRVPGKDAVLFADGDTVAGPTGYLHLIEGVRRDIDIYSSWGLVFGNRLFRPFHLTPADQRDRVRGFVRAEKRPVYYVNRLSHDYAVDDYGLLSQVDKRKHGGLVRFSLTVPVIRFYSELLREPTPRDEWTRFERSLLLGRMSVFLLRADGCRQPSKLREWCDHALSVAATDLHGNLAQAKTLLRLHGRQAAPEVLRRMTVAEGQLDQAIHKKDYGIVYKLRGDALALLRRPAAAEAAYRRSVAEWPARRNPARAALAALASKD